MITKKLLIPVVFALAATLSAGCETTGTEARVGVKDQLRMDVDTARSIADEALRTANSAAYAAATAKDLGLAASEAANAAQACCDANSRRMSRMFSGSMSSK